jgi:hypothetical protein
MVKPRQIGGVSHLFYSLITDLAASTRYSKQRYPEYHAYKYCNFCIDRNYSMHILSLTSY